VGAGVPGKESGKTGLAGGGGGGRDEASFFKKIEGEVKIKKKGKGKG